MATVESVFNMGLPGHLGITGHLGSVQRTLI